MPKSQSCQNCTLIHRREVRYKMGAEGGIMVIGQSPAREEVDQNEPFSGKSGQILRSVITHAGITVSQVTLANALRCQEGIPGLSGAQLRTSILSCKPNLLRAIEHVRPRLIVIAGNHALMSLTGKSGITNKRGVPFVTKIGELETIIFPTLHPAAIMREVPEDFLRNPEDTWSNRAKEFVGDWHEIHRISENNFILENQLDTSNYYPYEMLADGFWLDAHLGPVAVDLETVGTNPRDPNFRILGLSYSLEEGHARFVPYEGDGFPGPVRRMLSRIQTKYVAARPFDEHALHYAGIPTSTHSFTDVLTMAHVVDENYHAFNLETIAELHAGMRNIKDVAQGYRFKLQDAPPDVLMRYACVDADATLRVGKALREKIKKDTRLEKYFWHFLHNVQSTMVRLSREGCRVDLEVLQRNKAEAKQMMDDLELEMINHTPPEVLENHIADGKEINYNRLDLVRDVVFRNNRPIDGYVTEKTNLPQVSEEHLSHFKGDRFVDAYLQWKKVTKIYSSYLNTIEESVTEGRIYPTTSFSRTVTGRTVMLNPAIQTFPARGSLARLIRQPIVPDEGHVFMAFDLAQSELRIAGWLAGETEILGALQLGIDLHTQTAALVNDVPIGQVTKEMRQRAKGVNFGLIYGMSAPKLKEYLKSNYGVEVTEQEAEEIRGRFFTAYPMLQQWYTRVRKLVTKKGWVESPMGRRRRLPGVWNPDRQIQSEALRQAINSPVQSFSSDLGLICMELLSKYDFIRPMWFIHDAVVMQVPVKRIYDAEKTINHEVTIGAAVFLQSTLGVKVGYPIECDIKVGNNWADMRPIEEWRQVEQRDIYW